MSDSDSGSDFDSDSDIDSDTDSDSNYDPDIEEEEEEDGQTTSEDDFRDQVTNASFEDERDASISTPDDQDALLQLASFLVTEPF